MRNSGIIGAVADGVFDPCAFRGAFLAEPACMRRSDHLTTETGTGRDDRDYKACLRELPLQFPRGGLLEHPELPTSFAYTTPAP